MPARSHRLVPLAVLVLLPLLAVVPSHAVAAEGEVPAMPTDLLFIHHSCGGQLLADEGPMVGGARDSGERCLYVSHPNGGGLRQMLESAGYTVNEASYGSIVGEDTDICHWRAKFDQGMDRILRTARNDALLPDGRTNRIVVFKSCYPNNRFTGRGDEPGDPDSCELTVANAKATYDALLPLFRRHPDVLFIAVTAPPLAEYVPQGMKEKIKSWFAREDQGGDLAVEFNAWLAGPDGWLAGYDLPNVAVFDYYHVLTGEGAGAYAAYPARVNDSHPSSDGNARAAGAFMPVLAGAVKGMGW